VRREEVETVVIGSGPGGATVAREVARAGRPVLLLERGRDWRRHPVYGTYPGALLYTDKHALLFTREGMNVIRPLMLGGATSMYCGCSAPPLPWWKDRYGIDLDGYAADITRELRIAPLAPGLRGVSSTRVAEAAGELGMEWVPQDKFMQPGRAERFDCSATCMLGCRCGAKWNAAEYVDDAVAAGARVWTRATAEHLLVSDGQVVGVQGRRAGEPFEVRASTVVVAAGGIGTPVLLRRSGLAGAGQGMTMDTTLMVYGHAPFKGIGDEPPMTWSYADDELGVLYSTLIDPWLNYPLVMAQKAPRHALSWHRWGRTLGVMIKLKDEISGEVDQRGRISKGLTAADRERLTRAESVAGSILRRTGCDPDTILSTPLRGTHPSGTVRIGAMLSTDLETEVRGLYVCDASVFPEALARPTVLTILSLARRLADHLRTGATPRGAAAAPSIHHAAES
jgi:choline dehydrogenase-like flavoprotein